MNYSHYIKRTKVLAAAFLCVGMLMGCSSKAASDSGAETVTTLAALAAKADGAVSFEIPKDAYYFDWQAQSSTAVDLSAGSTEINKSGLYVLSGSLQDGSVTVNVDKTQDEGTVFLVLNGANLTSSTATPLNIMEAKQVTLILAEGSTNTVTQGAVTTTDTEFPSAALFSKADLAICGSGSLTVKTSYNDAIGSKDDLVITGGKITVEAAGDGIVGKDFLAIENAEIQVKAGKDGLRASNSTDEGKGNVVIASGTVKIEAANDGIQAERVLQVSSGTFTVSSGGGYPGKSTTTGNDNERGPMGGHFGQAPGQETTTGQGAVTDGSVTPKQSAATGTTATGQAAVTPTPTDQTATDSTTTETSESMKGLKAGEKLLISGGSYAISSYDDAIHSNGSVSLSGGNYTIETGDDAVHAELDLTVSGGEFLIQHCYEGLEGQTVTQSGGTVSIVADDDAVNASDNTGGITISGGELTVESKGDGIDSNGYLTISGGTIIINEETIAEMDSAIDYDGAVSHTGGTVQNQNGETIDPTVTKQPGGNRGGGKGMAPGTRPDGSTTPPTAPADGKTQTNNNTTTTQ